ncbi:MAG: ABC transporter substrate-binding protein [Oscillospiraceae bacterium]|jgi:oligopeptide transport system substrate-binding protein|nr:ABC transporter substrate-binding protein [Oscillospiraceae bacterium]
MKKLLTLALALCMLLSIVGGGAAADELKELHTYEVGATREVESWNVQLSQMAVDSNVTTNLIDGLLTNDPKGALIGAAAKEWSSEDGGQTWTFILNDGMTWVDYEGNIKADVKAEDWLYGLEWVLNFAKNDSANTSMPIEMIKGAGEYYDYTKALTESEGAEVVKALGLEKFLELVGVSAPDDKTLIYTCTDKLSYFPTLATYNGLYPVSGKLIEEIGVDGYRAVSWDTMWYSGPYTVTSYIHTNEKVLTPNPHYYAADTTKRFDSVTIKIVDSTDVAFSLFQTGELDHVTLSQSNLNTIYGNPSNEWYPYLTETRPTKFSYQIHFSYDKKLASGEPDVNWNTAIANEAFRLSWYYGLDAVPYLKRQNAINPLSGTNYVYTGNNVSVNSEGVDYTQLVRDEIGLQYSNEEYARTDPEKAAEYKAQAIEELTALGVTFPVYVDYWFQGSNQTAKDTADVLTQMFSDTLGDDYVVLRQNTYVTSITQEVRNPQLASFLINGWGADFGDPINFLGQETYGEDNAYYSQVISNINKATDETLIATYKEFTRLVNEAKAITDDQDARLNAFAKAEAYMLQHVLVLPWSYETVWQLTAINDYSKIYSAYGIQNYRYVNWETNSDIYTTEDYAELKAK